MKTTEKQISRKESERSCAGEGGGYMRPSAAAKYTNHSESTLAKLRMRHNRDKGPRYIKRGGVIVYRRADLDAWLEKHFIEGGV